LWLFGEAVKAGVGSDVGSFSITGFVVSDWAATINGVQTALAGLDMNMTGFIGYNVGPQNDSDPATAMNSWWGAELIEMVNNGKFNVTRTIAAWYKMGQDSDYPDVSFSQLTHETFLNGELVDEHINAQGDHYKPIRQIGAATRGTRDSNAGQGVGSRPRP
ncbi:hypothetical protein K438DRAFT_1606232, partial [Mycena galopus ATCC 62051]